VCVPFGDYLRALFSHFFHLLYTKSVYKQRSEGANEMNIKKWPNSFIFLFTPFLTHTSFLPLDFPLWKWLKRIKRFIATAKVVSRKHKFTIVLMLLWYFVSIIYLIVLKIKRAKTQSSFLFVEKISHTIGVLEKITSQWYSTCALPIFFNDTKGRSFCGFF
jgi:hypothetical protein